MLESAPSLSIYANNIVDEVEEDEEKDNGLRADEFKLKKSVKIRANVDEQIVGSGDFSFAKPNMGLIEENGDEEIDGVVKLGSEKENSDEYFKVILEEFPNHPQVLKNYAQFLMRKGDLRDAEEYCLRATKVSPNDGEILSQYAILLWELHRNQQRASKFFMLAAQTAPYNSIVLAAYAKFLWEINDDEVDDQEELQPAVHFHPADDIGSADPENYNRMTEKGHSDSLYLKNYAQFLYQTLVILNHYSRMLAKILLGKKYFKTGGKNATLYPIDVVTVQHRDLQGAEEYYSRFLSDNPLDGEMLLQYATLLWELYHDRKRSLSYMKLAVQASPEDCNILAAYAHFLLSMDDDDDDDDDQ